MRLLYASKRGFSLAEIVVVAGIIALIATVVIANVSEARKKARDVQRTSDIAQLQVALKLYNDAHGTYNVGSLIADGEGVEWMHPDINQALYDSGLLPTSDLQDPQPLSEEDYGYMLALCEDGRRYALFATKEIPADEDTAHAESLCMGADENGPVMQYQKNYGVGN